MDIDTFLQKFFTPRELEEAFAPKEDKLTTLARLIERAKKGDE